MSAQEIRILSDTDNLLVKISIRKTTIVKKPKSDNMLTIAVANEDTVHLFTCGNKPQYNLGWSTNCVASVTFYSDD